MTRDEIAKLMNETSGQEWGSESHFQRFAAALVATEREACAQLCDEHAVMIGVLCAQAIRARGNE